MTAPTTHRADAAADQAHPATRITPEGAAASGGPLHDAPSAPAPASDSVSNTVSDALPELAARRDELVARYAGPDGLDEAMVRARLDAVCRRLAGARVRGYLPVLVERGLRESLGRG